MFSLKNYLPDATLSKYMKVLVKADESVFVKIFLNKQLKTERFIREDEILDAVVELNEGKNHLQIEGENLEGNKYVLNKSIRYLEKPFAIVDQNYAGCDKDVAGGIVFCKSLKSLAEILKKENSSYKTVFIRNGIYREKVNIDSSRVMLIGEDRNNTIVIYSLAAGFPAENGGILSTSNTAAFTISGEDFVVENITFENCFDKNVPIEHRQAVAVKALADRLMFFNCAFKSTQDTLYADFGRQYYYRCYIEGDVDFIFGAATAVFEECVICSLDREDRKIKGYVTAASTKPDSQYGFLFIRCKLISNIREKECVYLGRPWHPSSDPNRWVNVVFRECYLDEHIHTDGWCEMHGFCPENERFFEYKNFGPGSSIQNPKRPQLNENEAQMYTKEKVFGDWKVEI
ncbi:Pectinesterase [Caldicellulosiruptor kronotskyensis 2002]|uniref:Pectinesterase n=1 Tax=Caldicellulosiruptor kronotskyensis (strain DSM 18902 / VKM B-2412 / 2002) TaxID=632348 RepID=E4SCS2_CALK2|nr:pectinesterase family protein [Caldicellulosiruptor kronotskyensis]ADQ45055.1 Pectinesterase [Caldicellulosiruptor kronotskyensis 2002]